MNDYVKIYISLINEYDLNSNLDSVDELTNEVDLLLLSMKKNQKKQNVSLNEFKEYLILKFIPAALSTKIQRQSK